MYRANPVVSVTRLWFRNTIFYSATSSSTSGHYGHPHLHSCHSLPPLTIPKYHFSKRQLMWCNFLYFPKNDFPKNDFPKNVNSVHRSKKGRSIRKYPCEFRSVENFNTEPRTNAMTTSRVATVMTTRAMRDMVSAKLSRFRMSTSRHYLLITHSFLPSS